MKGSTGQQDDRRQIERFTDLLITYSKNGMGNLSGGQDSFMRFVYCCFEKINKCFCSIKQLYSKQEYWEDIEFSLGIILRSLLMDAILVQYLKFLTTKYDGKNEIDIKAALMEMTFKYVADGSSYILKEVYENNSISQAQKDQVVDNIVNFFPGVFKLDAKKGRYAMDPAFKFSLADLYTKSDHPDVQIRKKVYELYQFYSKYDHVSHWTSIAANIEQSNRTKQINAAIAMVSLNFRDLLEISKFHENMRPWVTSLVHEIDTEMAAISSGTT